MAYAQQTISFTPKILEQKSIKSCIFWKNFVYYYKHYAQLVDKTEVNKNFQRHMHFL